MFVYVRVFVFYLEVLHGDSKGIEQISIDSLVVKVYEGQLLADGLQGSF